MNGEPIELQIAGLFPQLWDLALDGFDAIAGLVSDADLEKFFVNASAAAYFFDGARCRAVLMVDPIDVPSGRVRYFAGAVVHSELRGRGIRQPMVLLRLALGRLWGCELANFSS